MTLHLKLGVNDIPYVEKGTPDNKGMTTGDLADILEAKYHVMEVFYELHTTEIAGLIAESSKNALEAIMNGTAPATLDPWGAATSAIELMFQKAIDMKEFDGVMPGVPTKASLDGTSARFKKPNSKYKGKGKNRRKRGARPSFQFSGQYEDSFRAWVDNGNG